MSLYNSLSGDKKAQVKAFTDLIKKEKLINEIQQLMFDLGLYTRWLAASNFNINEAMTAFKRFLQWRKDAKIDQILEHEFTYFNSIKKFFPNGFHNTDDKGRPIFFIHIGQTKLKELFEIVPPDTLIHFLIKELEMCWRQKFVESTEWKNKKGVDQMKVVLDLKGAKLKDINNKQTLQLFKMIVKELQLFYPEMVHQVFVVNTPMFIDQLWNSDLKQAMAGKSSDKIFFTGNKMHPKMLEQIDDMEEFPCIYGGECECEAQCIYSDVGPWSDCENKIDYSQSQGKKNISMGGAQFDMSQLTNKLEEFKMEEEDDDQIDLLNDNMPNLQNQMNNLGDLKNMISMNLPQGHGMSMDPSQIQNQTKNNTLADETQNTEEKEQITSNIQNNIIKLPGQTPMNTQQNEDI